MSTTDIDLGTCCSRLSSAVHSRLSSSGTHPARLHVDYRLHTRIEVGGVNNATMRAYTYVPLTPFVPVKKIDLIEPAGFHEVATHCSIQTSALHSIPRDISGEI